MDGDQAGNATTLDVFAAYRVARALGCDHDHVDLGGRIDQSEMNVEPVCEGERAARFHLARDFIGINRRLMLVGCEDHQDVGPFGGFGDGLDRESGPFGLLGTGRPRTQRDGDFAHAAVAQVLRMRVTLAAIADNDDLLVLDQLLVAIGVVVNLHCSSLALPLWKQRPR